jgi:hypothetical protein
MEAIIDELSALIREKDRTKPGMSCKGILPDPQICKCCCERECRIHDRAFAIQPREEA